MEESTTRTVGIDIGDKHSEICVLDGSGEVESRTQVRTTREAICRYFEREERWRVAIEVGAHSRWMSQELSALGHEVYVANARKLRAIYENDKKTDRTDAQLLAEIAQLKPGLLCPIKHRGEHSQAALSLIRTRSALVRARTLLVNHVRAIVKTVGARLPSCATNSFHNHLDAVPEERRAVLEPVMKQIRELTAHVRGYDKAIAQEALARPEAVLVTEIPGVGPLTALAFTATIEDPHRFNSNRQVGSYLGLRPRLDQSGAQDPQLRITKAGDKSMRQLLVQCAHYILGRFGPDSDLRRWGLALAARGGKSAKKRAAVAVARKLAVMMLSIWKSNSKYQPLRNGRPALAEATKPVTEKRSNAPRAAKGSPKRSVARTSRKAA